MRKTRNTISQVLSGSLRLLGNTFTSLADICGNLQQSRIGELPVDPDTVEELTFVYAMRWLTENKPTTSSICRAALLREYDSRGEKISFVYLDGRDQLITNSLNIPAGKTVIAKRLDRELSEYFADQPLVVFA